MFKYFEILKYFVDNSIFSNSIKLYKMLLKVFKFQQISKQYMYVGPLKTPLGNYN